MKVIATAIKDVVIIEPQVFGDDRGYFFESYSQQQFDQAVRPVCFVQDNESKSRRGVLRGLHFQRGPQPNPNWCGSFRVGFWTSPSIYGADRPRSANTSPSN